MSYKKTPIFFWNEELGQATCCYDFHGQSYWSEAQCHPDDEMFKSEKIGCTIAEMRARINALRQYRDAELRPGLKALKQLYYSINTSKYYNAENYTEKMITRQIELKEMDIKTVNEEISKSKEELKNYLQQLAKVHASIKRHRLDKNT